VHQFCNEKVVFQKISSWKTSKKNLLGESFDNLTKLWFYLLLLNCSKQITEIKNRYQQRYTVVTKCQKGIYVGMHIKK
jgi:sulfur transfer protein SufE